MLLRDDFMDLYTYKTETWATKFLGGWLQRAKKSKIEPIKRTEGASRMIRRHFDGVVASVTFSLIYLNCGGLTLEKNGGRGEKRLLFA